jgi:hypothetical protein
VSPHVPFLRSPRSQSVIHAAVPVRRQLGILGFHVGVWAVQLASLSASLGLVPAALGAAVTVAAAVGLVTLFGPRLRASQRAGPVIAPGEGGDVMALADEQGNDPPAEHAVGEPAGNMRISTR